MYLHSPRISAQQQPPGYAQPQYAQQQRKEQILTDGKTGCIILWDKYDWPSIMTVIGGFIISLSLLLNWYGNPVLNISITGMDFIVFDTSKIVLRIMPAVTGVLGILAIVLGLWIYRKDTKIRGLSFMLGFATIGVAIVWWFYMSDSGLLLSYFPYVYEAMYDYGSPMIGLYAVFIGAAVCIIAPFIKIIIAKMT